MGSTFGNSTRCFPSLMRQPGSIRTLAHLSPRATPYALGPASSPSSTSSHSSSRTEHVSCVSSGMTLATPNCCDMAPVASKPHKAWSCGRTRQNARFAGVVVVASSSCSLLLPNRRIGRRRCRVVPLPALPAAAAEAEADMEMSYTSTTGLIVTVRKVRTLNELRQVAVLRADAYYAENQSRFVGSLKKKFAEQEIESLQQRTTILSRNGKPYSECLVAVDASSGAVLGCIDMRLPAALNGMHPHGVPQDDPAGCYLLNVVVREDVRGQGLGKAAMRAAMARAVHVWGAARLYTHVEADNEVASGLYGSCGFAQHSLDAKYEAASKLGQTVLLQAPASAAGPLATEL